MVATCQGKINAIGFFCLQNLEDVSWLLKVRDTLFTRLLVYFNYTVVFSCLVIKKNDLLFMDFILFLRPKRAGKEKQGISAFRALCMLITLFIEQCN